MPDFQSNFSGAASRPGSNPPMSGNRSGRADRSASQVWRWVIMLFPHSVGTLSGTVPVYPLISCANRFVKTFLAEFQNSANDIG